MLRASFLYCLRNCTMRRLLAAAVSMGVLVACSSMTSIAATTPALDGTAWTLKGLTGRTLITPTPTLRFDGGRAAGSDSCNRYTVSVSVKGAGIEFGQRGASTQMACAQDVMNQADAFVAALQAARSYRLAGSELQLLDAAGAPLAVFVAQSQALAGTAWRAVNINNGRGAVVSLVNGTTVTLAFGTDGRISGSAGCNRFTGSYAQDGRKLSLGAPASTRMACPEPAGVMEQEAAFLKALTTVATARVEGERLEMRTADGALAAMFTRAAN
jgi:heat shock protein HslJ